MCDARSWTSIAGSVLAILVMAVPAQAQGLSEFDYENLSFRGLGVSVGFITPNKLETTTSYNVILDLGFLGPNLRIQSSVSYWKSDFKESEVSEFEERLSELVERSGPVANPAIDLGVLSWSDIVVGMDGDYLWPGTLEFSLGLGLAAHVMNGEGIAIKDTFVEDLLDRITIGANAHLGLAREFNSQFKVTGQVRYEVLDDLRYPEARFGGVFMVGGRPTL